MSFERALALAPGEFDVHFQRGVTLALLDRHAESVAAFNEAIALDEGSAEAANNRGAVLMRLFRPQEALSDFARASALNPDYTDAHLNAGHAHRGLGQHAEALQSYDRALELRPEDEAIRWSKAVLTLGLGDFRTGWPLYESRLALEPARQLHQRALGRPRWSGATALDGQTIFIYAEQGLGDTLQFCRYIPLLNAMGATVVFEVQPVLTCLMGSLPMRGTLIGRGDELPSFDVYSPLLSLPLALRTELDTVPHAVPYLSVDPGFVRQWQEKLKGLRGLKVGINWHGNPEAEKRLALQARSFPLAAAAPLASIPGVSLISLQKGNGAEQRDAVAFGASLAQLTDPSTMGPQELAEETAAILMSLDLLITADTALAHLAGALGVPVWVVLQSVPDWRWGMQGEQKPSVSQHASGAPAPCRRLAGTLRARSGPIERLAPRARARRPMNYPGAFLATVGLNRLMLSASAGQTTGSRIAPPTAPTVPEDPTLFASPTTRDHIGRIVVPVKINGRGPFRFIVDTGASDSTVSPHSSLRPWVCSRRRMRSCSMGSPVARGCPRCTSTYCKRAT